MCVHKDIVPGMHPLTHMIVHMKHTCTVAHPSHAGTHVCTRQHVPHVFIRLNDYLLSILMRQGPCRALVMLQRTKQTKPPARMELTVWGQSQVARQIDEIHSVSGGDKCYGGNEAGRGGRGARRAGRNCASKQDGRARSHAHRHEGGEPLDVWEEHSGW